MMLWHLTRRELWGWLGAPFSWFVTAAFLAINGIFGALILDTFVQMSAEASLYGEAEGLSVIEGVVQPMAGTLGLMLVLFLPTLTMRLLAEEAEGGTLPLLLSSPVRSWQIVVAKWLALVVLLVAVLGLGLAWLPATLFAFSDPPAGPLLSSALGVVLLIGMGSAAGLAASSLTRSQVLAGVLAWAALLALWIATFLESDDGPLAHLGALLGLIAHYERFAQGLVRSDDLAYFGILTLLALVTAWQRVESHRWS